ncbi:MAG: PTS sugar transporter subunit IIA [Planctomycetes bacterium]|nr:PTS sugar transporter subunit IIA [Planctomycetota bacterium]
MLRLTRYLRPSCIRLDLASRPEPEPDPSVHPDRLRWKLKESVLGEIVDLLIASGRAGNPSKLLTDVVNRERKASTSVGQGVAIPHVRTMQAKGFIVAYARSIAGIDFDSPDGLPVHHFLALAAPPYDDATYLKIYREIGTLFADASVRDALLRAEDEHAIIGLFARGPEMPVENWEDEG